MRVHMTGSEWFGSRPGGLNRYFESLYMALRASGLVDVSACAFGEPPLGGTSWGSTDSSTLARLRAASASRIPVEAEIVDRHFAMYGRVPLRSKSALVVHFQGPWAAESALAGAGRLTASVKSVVETIRYRSADQFVVLSRPFQNLLVSGYQVDPARVSVIPPGVDLARFTPQAAEDGPPVVICVRRLERRMGIDVLLDAWPAAVDAVPDARLVIVGRGSDGGRLHSLAAASSCASSISFAGSIDDKKLVQAYASCAISVVPSIALEGFGLIALESLAAGRPPIVTNCGGLPDAVNGLDPSLIVPPRDANALGARIASALTGNRPSADRCRRHAEQFSWGAVARRHVELYAAIRS